jgi:hypothetical protein
MRVVIETIPLKQAHKCGYETCGDWHFDHEGALKITVTETGNPASDLAVAVHEAVEALHCKMNGISELQVSQHDIQFERERVTGKHKEEAEPGDDPRAPYRESHQRANHVERAVCHALDLLWDDHEVAVQATQ